MADPEFLDPNLFPRYQVLGKIARGCYGLVWRAIAYQTEGQEQYAVKRMLNAFKSPKDAQRTYREVMLLLELSGHANIVEIFDVRKAQNDLDLYVVTGFMDTTLNNLLQNARIKDVHQRFITYQICRALLYIHTGGIIHRDIKPQNILINKQCRTKLCDFGLARTLFKSEEEEQELTPRSKRKKKKEEERKKKQQATPQSREKTPTTTVEEGTPMDDDDDPGDEDGFLSYYIGARWYRAPELLLHSRSYDYSIDVWGMACSLAEMFTTGFKPLFKATCMYTMLEKQYEILGKPSAFEQETMNAPYTEKIFQADLTPDRKPLASWIFGPSEALDFIELILTWSPVKRMTITEAITHPYVNAFHNPDDEPTHKEWYLLPVQDDKLFPVSTYRDIIYADVMEVPRAMQRLGRNMSGNQEEEEGGGGEEGGG